MDISRRQIKVSPEEISLHLKDVGRIILDRKRRDIPNEEIARRLSYDFYATMIRLHIWPSSEVSLQNITQKLDKCFSKPLHTEINKFNRALSRQFSQNDFFEREGMFLDNIFIRDLSSYINNNNLKTRIIGLSNQKLTFAIKKEEQNQILSFIASWAGQFGSVVNMPYIYEDLTTRTPTRPKPDKFNPLIKKEKITSILP